MCFIAELDYRPTFSINSYWNGIYFSFGAAFSDIFYSEFVIIVSATSTVVL